MVGGLGDVSIAHSVSPSLPIPLFPPSLPIPLSPLLTPPLFPLLSVAQHVAIRSPLYLPFAQKDNDAIMHNISKRCCSLYFSTWANTATHVGYNVNKIICLIEKASIWIVIV